MVYNWETNKMKRFLTIIVTIFCMSIYCIAQPGSASCKIEGGGYIQADYYEDGRLVISNQSEHKTASVNVTVSCTITYPKMVDYEVEETDFYGEKQTVTKQKRVKDTKTVTIFNGVLYDFEQYSSTEIPNNRNKVTIKAKKDFQIRDAIKYEYTVRVGNPICN